MPRLLRYVTIVAGLVGCGGDNEPIPILTWPASAAIPLVHADGVEYTAMITVGTQTFSLELDTGSSTLVIAGSTCDPCSRVSPLYVPGPSAKDTGNSTSGTYSDLATFEAEIYDDQVGLGNGTPAVPLQIAALTNETLLFADNATQGILGLGPPQDLFGDTTAYVTTAAASSATTEITFELCADTGTMWIGDFDPTTAAGPPQFTPLIAASDDDPYYNLTVTDIALGGTSLGVSSSTFVHPFLDTGTSDYFVPTQAYDAVIAAINQAAGTAALFPGQQLASAGALCFGPGAVTAAQVDAMLPPMSTTFPDGDGGSITMSASATASYLTDVGGGQFCLAIGDGGDGSSSQTILGDTFIRGFVTVLDLPNHRVGFAPDVGCPASTARPDSLTHPHRRRR